MLNSSRPSSSSPYNSTAKIQRREIKQIAVDCDSIINTYRKSSNAGLTELKIVRLQGELHERHQRLELLRAQGLSAITPTPGAMSRVRSGAALAGGTVSRGIAVAGSGVGAAAHLGLSAAAIPYAGFMGALDGALTGGTIGSQASSHALVSVPVAVVSAVAGGAVGAGLGVIGTAANAVPTLASRGSLPKKAFRSIDGFPGARAHVQRKSMSTADIAATTTTLIADTFAEMECKSMSLDMQREHTF